MLVRNSCSRDVLFEKIQSNHWMAAEVWVFVHLAFWGKAEKIKGHIWFWF